MKIIIIVVFLLFSSSSNIINKPANGCLQMDIMLLGDFSSSVQGYESFISGAFSEFVQQFELSEYGIKIGLVTFTTTAYLNCPLTNNTKLLRSRINDLKYFNGVGHTNMLDAFAIAQNQFIINGRDDYKKIIIVISDGEPDSGEEVLKLANVIKQSKIGICGILVMKNKTEEEDNDSLFYYFYGKPIDGNVVMKKISSDFCYVESNYDNLIKELKKLDICM